MLLIAFTPEDGKALLDRLALTEFRIKEDTLSSLRPEIDEIHRRFHYEVAVWLGRQGWRTP